MGGEVREEGVGQGASDFSKRVTVEEEEWGAAMARLEKLKSFQQAQLGRSVFFPFLRNRTVSLRVNASLRLASFAESLIDLGDRCPRPVLEKLGSAL